MKWLNGKELAEYIKQRQAHEVRALRQARQVEPKLAIVTTGNNPVTELYTRVKQQYGADISVDVAIHLVEQPEAAATIRTLNADPSVHGIIVQLPLANPDQTEELLNLVSPDKDVDALGENPAFDPATPMAILWLLAGYNVDLRGKKVVLIGKGRLVGRPLERMLKNSDVQVESVDRTTEDIAAITQEADVIITATGSPAVLHTDMIKQGAIVVDAGVAGEEGKTVGDLDADVYERDDLTITPKRGGVGPLTVCALFENVIRAARHTVETTENT